MPQLYNFTYTCDKLLNNTTIVHVPVKQPWTLWAKLIDEQPKPWAYH